MEQNNKAQEAQEAQEIELIKKMRRILEEEWTEDFGDLAEEEELSQRWGEAQTFDQIMRLLQEQGEDVLGGVGLVVQGMGLEKDLEKQILDQIYRVPTRGWET